MTKRAVIYIGNDPEFTSYIMTCNRWQHFKIHTCASSIGTTKFLTLISNLKKDYQKLEIVAHRKGTQVVWRALRNTEVSSGLIFNIFLLGGTLKAHKSWWGVTQNIKGYIFNFSSYKDNTLKKISPRPIGLPLKDPSTEAEKGIRTRLANVINLDITSVIKTNNYVKELPTLIDEIVRNSEDKMKRRLTDQEKDYPDWRDEFIGIRNPNFM